MGIKTQRKYIECLERDVEWLENEMTAVNSPFGHAGGGTHKPEAGFESIVARKAEKEQKYSLPTCCWMWTAPSMPSRI